VSLQTRLQALITAVGADIKRLDGRIDAVGGGSGGADPWISQALTTAYVNATVTATDVFTGFAPAANTHYIVDVLASVQSSAATVGVQAGLVGPTTGITRAAVKIVSAASATADKVDHIALNAFQASTAGLATPNLLMLQAIVEVGATPGAGNIRLQAKAEVAGTNAITIHPGSSMRWRTI
jgi:hypothetical protein